MSKNLDYVRLVERAQNGDKQGLEHLSELAEERLREDVGRITLNPDLTQDIVQETMLEMLKKLDKLREIDRFWKWLTNIAYLSPWLRRKLRPLMYKKGARIKKKYRQQK